MQYTFFSTHYHFLKHSVIHLCHWTKLTLKKLDKIGPVEINYDCSQDINLHHSMEAMLMMYMCLCAKHTHSHCAPGVSHDLCHMEDKCCFFTDLLITQEISMEYEPGDQPPKAAGLPRDWVPGHPCWEVPIIKSDGLRPKSSEPLCEQKHLSV